MAQTSQQSSPASDASDAAADTDLKRGLSARHMQMIAIGGAIGTGRLVRGLRQNDLYRRTWRRYRCLRADRYYGAVPHAVSG